jgi:predicted CoA-substrate-specific enzyme activase
MIVAGCDIGSLTAKAVIMENTKILGSALIRAKNEPSVSAKEVMGLALKKAGLAMTDISYAVGTGYGKEQIPFADSVESEISCHGKGAFHLLPSVRMVIDIGGQDAKATLINENGAVVRYLYNDKCASGTGRFLEVMAEALEIPLEELGDMAGKSKEKLTISNQCVIFAETEVVSLVNEGNEICDIMNALHCALAKRVASMAKSIGVQEDVVMTGGVAKNSCVFGAISEVLNVSLKTLDNVDPQLIGALGAALYAEEMVSGLRESA